MGGLIDMERCESIIHDHDCDFWVTMMGCVDVPDSNWGDLRHWHAINISILLSFQCKMDIAAKGGFHKFKWSMVICVGLWSTIWKDHHGVSSGWSNVWHRSNTGLCSTQYEQIPKSWALAILADSLLFSVNNILAGLWLNCIFLQESFLSETNVYLGYACYFGGHLGFGIKMTPKHNFNTNNGLVALKLVGLEVLHKFLCYIGQNLAIPQIQDGHRSPSWITKKPTQRMIENHRFWILGTFKQLFWKNQLSRFFFPFQSLMLLNYKPWPLFQVVWLRRLGRRFFMLHSSHLVTSWTFKFH